MGVFDFILIVAADHPVIAVFFIVFLGIALIIGVMHETRFFGECLIVAIRFLKHEVLAWRDFLERLWRELTTWKSKP